MHIDLQGEPGDHGMTRGQKGNKSLLQASYLTTFPASNLYIVNDRLMNMERLDERD
jgi:hypothetical protein